WRTSHSSLPSRISFFCEVIRLRTSSSIFSSSFSVAVRICTTCCRIVSRSSTNSTSWLSTSTSVIWCDNRMIFSRVRRIFPFRLYTLRGCVLVARKLPIFLNFNYPITIPQLPASIRALRFSNFQLPISIFQRLPQDQLAVSGQLLLHFFVHLLIRHAR